MHEPAPPSGENLSDDYVKIFALEKEILQRKKNSKPFSAQGYYKISGELNELLCQSKFPCLKIT